MTKTGCGNEVKNTFAKCATVPLFSSATPTDRRKTEIWCFESRCLRTNSRHGWRVAKYRCRVWTLEVLYQVVTEMFNRTHQENLPNLRGLLRSLRRKLNCSSSSRVKAKPWTPTWCLVEWWWKHCEWNRRASRRCTQIEVGGAKSTGLSSFAFLK